MRKAFRYLLQNVDFTLIVNNHRGALLIGLIITMVIFATLGAAILSTTSTSTMTHTHSDWGTKAFYLAEAGYNYAVSDFIKVSKGNRNCLHCHASHSVETIRKVETVKDLSDNAIEKNGETYNFENEGKFKINLAPFWFKCESLNGTKLTVSVIESSDKMSECDLPERFKISDLEGVFRIDTIDNEDNDIRYYVAYNDDDEGTLTFQLNNDEEILPSGITSIDILDILPACFGKEGIETLEEKDDLEIKDGESVLWAFPNTKSVIELEITLIGASEPKDIIYLTYESVKDGKLTNLKSIGKEKFSTINNIESIKVALSKTVKVTSVGTYMNEATKTLVRYQWLGNLKEDVPIVYNTVKEGDSKKLENEMLAGGNFYWVAKYGGNDNNKGHNVLGVSEKDNICTPGATPGTCSACHYSLADTGCLGCHLFPKHHADDGSEDGSDTKLVNSKAQGWYRFLLQYYEDSLKIGDTGVKGVEHEKWNYGADKNSHNEYLGKKNNENLDKDNKGWPKPDNYVYGFDIGNTTTAFCTGCHGYFRRQKNSDDKWVRHPSDYIISNYDGDYNLNVPVARPALSGDNPSSAVTPGTDMVMCLSCHRAHGSQYDDSLRWTTDSSGFNGCIVCHTEINKSNCCGCHTMHEGTNTELRKLDCPPDSSTINIRCPKRN